MGSGRTVYKPHPSCQLLLYESLCFISLPWNCASGWCCCRSRSCSRRSSSPPACRRRPSPNRHPKMARRPRSTWSLTAGTRALLSDARTFRPGSGRKAAILGLRSTSRLAGAIGISIRSAIRECGRHCAQHSSRHRVFSMSSGFRGRWNAISRQARSLGSLCGAKASVWTARALRTAGLPVREAISREGLMSQGRAFGKVLSRPAP